MRVFAAGVFVYERKYGGGVVPMLDGRAPENATDAVKSVATTIRRCIVPTFPGLSTKKMAIAGRFGLQAAYSHNTLL
jgi:hypothetical protein